MMHGRRAFLAAGGQLMLGFALGGMAPSATDQANLPGDLAKHPDLDAWIRIDGHGNVTLLTGKVELGQGILTAFVQLCAEELDLPVTAITVISGDTAIVPDEGATAGSFSMPYGGLAVRQASAEVRGMLVELAAARWGVPMARLSTGKGAVIDSLGDRRLGYGALIGGKRIARRATGKILPHLGAKRTIAGTSVPRIDLPAKIAGREAFLHDLRIPGILHARVVRSPSPGAKLLHFDEATVRAMPGVVAIVRDGDFLAVVAGGQYQAVRAAVALDASAQWQRGNTLPTDGGIHAWMLAAPADTYAIVDHVRVGGDAVKRRIEARYTRPFLMHGSIGPSIAIATMAEGSLTIWTHSQTVFETARAIAELAGLPIEKVRCRHMQGAGCYGHNGADDAAADAALIATKLPGRPIRVQWSRETEHASEPYGSAMINKVAATVDANGDVLDWSFDLWSMSHNTRPTGKAGNLLAGQSIARPFAPGPTVRAAPPNYAADRNAIPYYAFPGQRAVTHLIAGQPVRVSALRSLGAFANVFAIESFMDELAGAAGIDPVAYRLRQLQDPRATDVIERAAKGFDWHGWRRRPGHGRGMAFARYKNFATYCAVMLEVAVDPVSHEVSLLRAVLAADAGETVNPDGLANQLEGGLLQSLSWALKEKVRFDDKSILSRNWDSYPILGMGEAPPTTVLIVDRPGSPFLGAGEAAQGPAGAALANAVADACGARVRDLPITPAAVAAALREA
ncbi:MAG: iorB2 [Bradyrhizobium sp.]|nr:iorB2 [Bradyrhizobium sp.]